MKHTQQILLVCAAGMSTSILVHNIEKIIQEQTLDLHVHCCDIESSVIEIHACDVILLAPQVSYFHETLEAMADTLHIPFAMLDPNIYRCFDGLGILQFARDLLACHEQKVEFHIELLHGMNGGALGDLLVMDMKRKSLLRNEKIKITTADAQTFNTQKCRAHVVLLEPQIAFMEKEIRNYIHPYASAFGVLDRTMVARFDGEEVLEYAFSLYEDLCRGRKEEYIKNEMEELF